MWKFVKVQLASYVHKITKLYLGKITEQYIAITSQHSKKGLKSSLSLISQKLFS